MGKTPEIPGYMAPPDVTHSLQHEVAQLLLRPKILSFPGSQPVSFSRKHIEESLFQEDYFVCEKSDGIRCLMYLTTEADEERVYLITRKNEYYWIPNLHFPVRGDMSRFHTGGVLVDGELIISMNSDGSESLKYLTFDCLALDGKILVSRSLDKRIAYMKEGLDDPYKELWKRYPEDCKMFPFKVERKEMERSYGLPKVFNEIMPRLKHTSDGLIFTPRESPYVFGTDNKILKWKPATENTIDFVTALEFSIFQDNEDNYPDYDTKPKFKLLVWQGGNIHTYFDEMYITDEEWSKMKSLNEPLDDRVIESYKDEQHRWRFHRFRDDKETANHISTVEKVIKSIEDSVTQEELLRACPTMRERWKERESGAVIHGEKRQHPL